MGCFRLGKIFKWRNTHVSVPGRPRTCGLETRTATNIALWAGIFTVRLHGTGVSVPFPLFCGPKECRSRLCSFEFSQLPFRLSLFVSKSIDLRL